MGTTFRSYPCDCDHRLNIFGDSQRLVDSSSRNTVTPNCVSAGGIGKGLVEKVHAAIGEQSMLLLLAAPEAQAYYPKIGFEAADNAWIIKRSL